MAFTSLLVLFTLSAQAFGANYKRVTCPDGVNTATDEACCAFFALRDDLQENLFQGECGEDAHEVLRLTFHDAIGWSDTGAFTGNGADGSMIIFADIETAYPANLGISDSVNDLAPFLTRHLVTAGDLIQFAGAIGITNCPGAPQLSFMAGRPNATIPAEIGTVPEPQDSVDSILARMNDAGFTDVEVVWLLSSHSIARADHVDPTIQAVPFDSTPFTFDTQIFLEVLLKGVGWPGTADNVGEVESPLPTEGEMRLQSDFLIARDNRTACEWQKFVNDQALMMKRFQQAMAKLAVLGQSSDLVDCSELIPIPVPPVSKPATYPATQNFDDIEQACLTTPFPTLSADAGPGTQIPACPDGDLNIADCPS